MPQKNHRDAPKNCFSQSVIKIIKKIPRGKVATYGQIAALAGSPMAARQVVRILHSCSSKYKLPWHRIINSRGLISLPRRRGYETQRMLLKKEGIKFGKNDLINLSQFLWSPTPKRRKIRSSS
jgi:methylated-DNA-protein-cysteine methyltransferase-like protein